ncbi:polyprenyl synthetase family protein [Nitrospira sp. Nam74]
MTPEPIAIESHRSPLEDALETEWGPKVRSLERIISQSFAEQSPAIQVIGSSILRDGGKRIRPLLLLLSAGIAGYQGTDDVILASLIESIHAATLFHDDVIDEADLRRNQPTTRKLWGNRASVFMGDYVYFQAVAGLIRFANPEVAEAVLYACRNMAIGELRQLSGQRGSPTTETAYVRIVARKTGALMASTCKTGGLLAGASPADCLALFRFGLRLGIAYQFMDDVLDYIGPRSFGKLLGQDLRQGLVTLPLVHLQAHCTYSERRRLQGLLGTQRHSHEAFEWVRTRLLHHGSIDYTVSCMRRYLDLAKCHLARFSDSLYKTQLFVIADRIGKPETS